MTGSVELGDVALVVDCEHRTAPKAQPGHEYAFSIGTRDIKGGRVDYDAAKKVDKETFDGWTRRAVPGAGDLILAREAPVGEVGYIDGLRPVCLGQRTVMIRLDQSRAHPRYVHYQLLSHAAQEWMAAHCEGSTVVHLNVSDVRRIPVELPPIAEQRRIAEVLGALDDLIDTNQRVADRLWSSAEAAFERTQSIASMQMALGEVIELKYGKALPSESRRPGSVPVVSSAGISGAHDTALVEGPGVVVGRKGSVGSVTWVDADFFPIDTAFYVQGDRVPMSWAYFILRSLPLDSMNTDSAVPGLNRANALALRVRVPDSDSLRDFDVVASELIGGARAFRAENEQLRRTRDELLPLLMSGAVRVRPEGVAA